MVGRLGGARVRAAGGQHLGALGQRPHAEGSPLEFRAIAKEDVVERLAKRRLVGLVELGDRQVGELGLGAVNSDVGRGERRGDGSGGGREGGGV
jgi:hypothetical protein